MKEATRDIHEKVAALGESLGLVTTREVSESLFRLRLDSVYQPRIDLLWSVALDRPKREALAWALGADTSGITHLPIVGVEVEGTQPTTKTMASDLANLTALGAQLGLLVVSEEGEKNIYRRAARAVRTVRRSFGDVRVHICHDMFYGLVTQRLRREGAGILVDLTGGNVNLRKWANVVRGRSLESDQPFLCTMADHPGRTGRSRAMAYRSGKRLAPVASTTGRGGAGGYQVFALGSAIDNAGQAADTAPEAEVQAYTERSYEDITIGVTAGAIADIGLGVGRRGLEINGRPRSQKDGWLEVRTASGRVGVLAAPLTVLWNGLAIYAALPAEGAFDHHVIAFFADAAPANLDEVLCLMKLRAIEHRVGVVLLARGVREAVKTNKYKNIQRFRERDGVFGFNAQSLGGTWSTATHDPTFGVPRQYFPAYLSLLNP
ncbi:MAG: hypothetical protein HYZ53_26235 [Planctomycetes bacterium]|nr:hypothetical protein [Planctomycetota bacterium]